MDKYSWSFDRDAECWSNSDDSIEDCICQAKEEADDEDTVYIGENLPFVPSVDAETVLDTIEEQASEFGGDVGDNWYAYNRNTMRAELDALSEELTAVVAAWLKKHGREPYFYQVDNVRPYALRPPEKGE